MFQFPGFAPYYMVPPSLGGGLSHWGTPRSKAQVASRGILADLRAPHRLRKPRHPLHALRFPYFVLARAMHGVCQRSRDRRPRGAYPARAAFLPSVRSRAPADSKELCPSPKRGECGNVCRHIPPVYVEDIGVEPIASCVQGRRSSQMS